MPEVRWKYPHRILLDKILWIQKQSLAPTELAGKARMKDLFRVVYEKSGSLASESNLSLSPEMQQSLLASVDAFEDVDGVVVIWDGVYQDQYAHPSGAP